MHEQRAPIPLQFLLFFSSGFCFFGRSPVKALSSLEAPALCCCYMRKACMPRDRGRRTIHPSPPLGLSSLLFKISKIFGLGTTNPWHAHQNMPLGRLNPSTSLRSSTKRTGKGSGGEQTYCHKNVLDVGLAQIQFCFWRASASETSQ